MRLFVPRRERGTVRGGVDASSEASDHSQPLGDEQLCGRTGNLMTAFRGLARTHDRHAAVLRYQCAFGKQERRDFSDVAQSAREVRVEHRQEPQPVLLPPQYVIARLIEKLRIAWIGHEGVTLDQLLPYAHSVARVPDLSRQAVPSVSADLCAQQRDRRGGLVHCLRCHDTKITAHH